MLITAEKAGKTRKGEKDAGVACVLRQNEAVNTAKKEAHHEFQSNFLNEHWPPTPPHPPPNQKQNKKK
jgi:hypothetical protein